jgi:hypothetical protein
MRYASKYASPQDALAKQQAILRTLATKMTMLADQQIDAIDIENATWADVACFAMEAELADKMLDALTKPKG